MNVALVSLIEKKLEMNAGAAGSKGCVWILLTGVLTAEQLNCHVTAKGLLQSRLC